MPSRSAIEDREDVGKGQDWEQVSQTRARLGHVQLEHAQIDDVPLEEDGDIQQLEKPDAELGREHLKLGRDLVVQHVRQRQHVDEMQDGRPEMPARGPAERDQQHPCDPQDRRIGHHVVDARQLAQPAYDQRQSHHHNPRPAVGDFSRVGRVLLELAQEHQPGQHRDQRPVAVFRPLPGCEQGVEAILEEPACCQRGKRQPEQSGHPRQGQAGNRTGLGGAAGDHRGYPGLIVETGRGFG